MTRIRRPLRLVGLLAPIVILAAGISAYDALAPASHHPSLVTTTPPPTPPAPVTATAIPTPAPTGPDAVEPCQISYGVNPATPIVPPPTATVPGGIPTGMAAYGGTMILLGPAGWSCEAIAHADGALTQVIHPPGEPLPAGNLNRNTTQTVEAVVGYLPAPLNGPAKALACPYIAAAKSDAQATGIPCLRLPAGEIVTQLDANTALVQDPPGVAGGGALSGGPSGAESLIFYNPTTKAAGMVNCVGAESLKTKCAAVEGDFRSRHAPPPGASAQTVVP